MTEVPSPTPNVEPPERTEPSAPPPRPAQGAPGTQPTEPTPRRRRLWAPLRQLLARYVQFWGRHRFLGCLGCLGALVVVAPLCLLTLRLGGGLVAGRTEREALWPLEPVEVNDIGAVVNDPSDQVEEYLAGLREFDAQRVWATYNEQVQSELTGRGRSPAELQRGLSEAQAQGAKIEKAVRIGNYPLRDGRRYVFYVITRSGFPPDGGTEEIYFVFTVDPAGKILSVT